MPECKCTECKIFGCSIWSFIISIVVGIIFGFLFSSGYIPVAINFIKVALVVSAIALAVLLVSLLGSSLTRFCKNIFAKCLCNGGKCVLIGSVGTLLFATAAATAGITVTNIYSVIFVAGSMLFFVFMMINMVKLLKCLIKQICDE